MKNKFYTVIPVSNNTYSINDMSNGAQVNRVIVPGKLISGPIVTQDQCSITTIENQANTTYILKLPSGAIINRFST